MPQGKELTYYQQIVHKAYNHSIPERKTPLNLTGTHVFEEMLDERTSKDKIFGWSFVANGD